jgi:succinoglycan biosynthesis protein ExoA
MYRDQFSGCPQLGTDSASDRLLIVIPCLNEEAHIGSLIAQVLEDTATLDRLIVVVDGGSTDGTKAILGEIVRNDPCVEVISNPRRIQSAGVNLAVEVYGEERQWLVRLDAHALYPKAYFSTLIAEARRTGAASVLVSMISQGSAGFQRAVAIVQNSVLGAGGAPHRRSGKADFVDHGHHALFDLKQFVAVGGYDETLSHNEDAEFDLRLARAGNRIWLTRDVEIVYFPRSSPVALYRQYKNYGRGRASTLIRHRKLPKLRQMLPACVAPAVVALLCAPWILAAAIPAFCWSLLCLVFGARLGLPQGIRCAVIAGFAAMIIHLSWSIGFWSELFSPFRQRRSGAPGSAFGAGGAS